MLGKKIIKHVISVIFTVNTVKTVKTFVLSCFELYTYELGLGGIYYRGFNLSIALLTGIMDVLYG